ncbi:hypothetical protein BC939DRAFT_503231 [Gamsiella multidivaricata]|uniref:uncharacterized protein n=1 Tax=Gamsiella multidivaricata TaxID=101098 RepID=UPI00221FEC59|nr:uncharacterized protein BC939DRAFT_503231 [Gamsiella multidivaricata]KAG0357990.1 chitin deacetylase [Gamsiella multidivaricata]KAI7823300.1 hypothetical protein BC939DRAFT_503231 [Gamsiella multidivaricata]
MVPKSSLSILVLALAVVHAQVPSTYPPPNAVPDTKSPQVQAWLKEIDLTGAPNIPLHKGNPPSCPNPPIPDECYWTCDGCSADDITACAAPNTWGLTFDDGPSVATPSLLDYLKKEKLSASFFVIGSNVIQYPDFVKREVAEGHHLASHTWSHHALTTLTNEEIVAEMRWTEKAVMDATGLKLKYMRPPYGDINNRVRFVLKKLGYIPVDWTGDEFDTNDWKMPEISQSQVIATFTKSLDAYAASNRSKGFYCLEHDLTADTVAVAQKLIPLGRARNISIAAVPVCESDAQPYQNGSNVTTTTISSTPTATTTGRASTTTTTAAGTNTPTPTSKNSASCLVGYSLGSMASALILGVLLA